MARTDPVFNLRMPIEMKDALAERARRNGRSLNAEIVQILEDAINDNGARDANDEGKKIPKDQMIEIIKLVQENLVTQMLEKYSLLPKDNNAQKFDTILTGDKSSHHKNKNPPE